MEGDKKKVLTTTSSFCVCGVGMNDHSSRVVVLMVPSAHRVVVNRLVSTSSHQLPVCPSIRVAPPFTASIGCHSFFSVAAGRILWYCRLDFLQRLYYLHYIFIFVMVSATTSGTIFLLCSAVPRQGQPTPRRFNAWIQKARSSFNVQRTAVPVWFHVNNTITHVFVFLFGWIFFRRSLVEKEANF